MAVTQPVSLLIPLEKRFCVLLKPGLPFGQLTARKRGHTWPDHPVGKITELQKHGRVFSKTWLPEPEQGRAGENANVGELKTAPAREDASLSGCHMASTGNDGTGRFCR